MKFIFIAFYSLVSIFFISGCATTTDKIYVPVYQEQNIIVPPKPTLMISSIKKSDNCQTVIKKYVVSLSQACSYAKQEETILKSLSSHSTK